MARRIICVKEVNKIGILGYQLQKYEKKGCVKEGSKPISKPQTKTKLTINKDK